MCLGLLAWKSWGTNLRSFLLITLELIRAKGLPLTKLRSEPTRLNGGKALQLHFPQAAQGAAERESQVTLGV
jgi:hypothetical protein